ncbi:nicotinamide/nicotinic acid mononucleotide adenylyltransferase 1 isoform X1 [Nilaparvata lugens]|uniref:nicotinamide/nicotinic acid mononucleotide adenylyltransferase 1 isoform X1 n=1 Tax=Nilaparvata lugens TaxID=108931 RepID=UPI00193E95B8|nr:nicotinamide/nicotinic acid mononucleotide adenylyltransferase 1 isoform X1 [Nilaparvata lugens]
MIPTKIVFLACGSFNPPTNMHLRMFELARDHLQKLGKYKVIGGLVSPVHDSYGKKELVQSTHRCAMLRLALRNSEWIQLSDWECNQESWMTTIQVLQYHQDKLNSAVKGIRNRNECEENDNECDWLRNITQHCSNNEKIVIKLLCGADLLESFGTPNLWSPIDIENIVGDHGLIVITRGDSNPFKFIYESDQLTRYQNNIVIVTEWITNDISSTKIRRSLRRNESVKYLIQDDVIDYIKNNGLYASLDNKYNEKNLLSNEHQMSSILLTPSPNEPHMLGGHRLSIDVPDSAGPGKYVDRKNEQNVRHVARERVKAAPGVAVAVQLLDNHHIAAAKAVRPVSLLSND